VSITYEWKIDFPLVLTIIGVIFSYIYTNISNKKNRQLNEWQILAEIYDDVLFLLSYPLKYKKDEYEYTNSNKTIEAIVNRKIKDYDLEIDQYWSYYLTEFPELKGMDKNEKERLGKVIKREYDNAMECRQSLSFLILSPAYYSDNEDVYSKLIHVQKHVTKNAKHLPKQITDLALETIQHDSKIIMMKYKAQLEYDDRYFMNNKPLFTDPYRLFILSLRRRHDWLILNRYEKAKEIARQLRNSKGKSLFQRDKWLYTGPIAL